MDDKRIPLGRFIQGQPVKFACLTSARVFRGRIVATIGDGYYYRVTDGTDRPPRIVRGNRLEPDPRID